MNSWYYQIGSLQKGPVAESDLQQLVKNGVIMRDTLVWSEGLDDWFPASEFEGLDWPVLKVQKTSVSFSRHSPPPPAPRAVVNVGQYPQPSHQVRGVSESEQKQKFAAVSVSDWVLSIFLLGIPVVNIIMLIVWLTDDQTKLSKKNWAKATLILIAVGFVFWLLFFLLFDALI